MLYTKGRDYTLTARWWWRILIGHRDFLGVERRMMPLEEELQNEKSSHQIIFFHSSAFCQIVHCLYDGIEN